VGGAKKLQYSTVQSPPSTMHVPTPAPAPLRPRLSGGLTEDSVTGGPVPAPVPALALAVCCERCRHVLVHIGIKVGVVIKVR
jgi:hypothetical protein